MTTMPFSLTLAAWKLRLLGSRQRREPISEHSRVSCTMVTRGNIDLVRTAYRCFKAQSWGNRELVIVCDEVSGALRQLAAGDPDEVRLIEAPRGLTLGDLRNMAASRASGEFLCQWDDDDLYDPDRIAAGMKLMARHNADAVFLQRWMLMWQARGLLAISHARVWEGSLLARRRIIPIYPSQSRSEDAVVTRWIRANARVVLLDRPELYCYRVTGENTWDDAHFEQIFARASRTYGPEEQAGVLTLPCFRLAGIGSDCPGTATTG